MVLGCPFRWSKIKVKVDVSQGLIYVANEYPTFATTTATCQLSVDNLRFLAKLS